MKNNKKIILTSLNLGILTSFLIPSLSIKCEKSKIETNKEKDKKQKKEIEKTLSKLIELKEKIKNYQKIDDFKNAFNVLEQNINSINLKEKDKYLNIVKETNDLEKEINDLLKNKIMQPSISNDEISLFGEKIKVISKLSDLGKGYDSSYILEELKKTINQNIEEQLKIIDKYFEKPFSIDNKYQNKIFIDINASFINKQNGLTLVFKYLDDKNNSKYSVLEFNDLGKNNIFNPNQHHFHTKKEFVFWNGQLTIPNRLPFEFIKIKDLYEEFKKIGNKKYQAKEFTNVLSEIYENFLRINTTKLEKSSKDRKIEYKIDFSKTHTHGDEELHYVIIRYVNDKEDSIIQGTISAFKTTNPNTGNNHEEENEDIAKIGDLTFYLNTKHKKIEKSKNVTGKEFTDIAQDFAKKNNIFFEGFLPEEKAKYLDENKIFDKVEVNNKALELLKEYVAIDGNVDNNKYKYFFDFQYGHSHNSHNYHLRVFIKNVLTNEVTFKDFHIESFYWKE